MMLMNCEYHIYYIQLSIYGIGKFRMQALNAHQFQMQYQTNFLPRSTSGGGFNRTVPAVEKQFAQNGIDMRAA
jgi:hypothetical protein